jgi:hypothetical protein
VRPVDTWREQFRKTIHYAYANAKFYKKHKDEFCNLTYSSFESLADLNMAFIKWGLVTDKIEPKKEIILSSNTKVKSVKTQYYIDLCDKFDCKAILVGRPTVVSYLDLELLKRIKIEVRVQEWAPRSYKQYAVTQFEPNLSMLDALFNIGNLIKAIKGTNRDYRIVK